jgi:hypothetical protein
MNLSQLKRSLVDDPEADRALVLSNLDEILVQGDREVYTFLSHLFQEYDQKEIYNRIWYFNEFKMSVKNKEEQKIQYLYQRKEEELLLEILSLNLDELLKSDNLGLYSILATYFSRSLYCPERKYRAEYNKVNYHISEIIKKYKSK